jgi:hypothetical protein
MPLRVAYRRVPGLIAYGLGYGDIPSKSAVWTALPPEYQAFPPPQTALIPDAGVLSGCIGGGDEAVPHSYEGNPQGRMGTFAEACAKSTTSSVDMAPVGMTRLRTNC